MSEYSACQNVREFKIPDISDEKIIASHARVELNDGLIV
jgi:hypothetical protein